MPLSITPRFPILLVDDNEAILRSYEIALERAGFANYISCKDSCTVPEILQETKVSLILLDLMMPGLSGEQLLEHIMAESPEIPVIVITSNDEVSIAVRCMKRGAYDYIVKPVERERLVSIVRRALEVLELQRENILLKQRILNNTLSHPEAFSEIITSNKSMQSLFQYAESVAQSPQPLLITGETGVGKELMAKAVHKLSKREGECVLVNVAGVDDNAFSDTLFGHLRGAFTGAIRDRGGLVEKAAGGTLVLDEIGDLSMESQVKLLRLIQEGEYYPLGSDQTKVSDARIIVSTNIDLTVAQEKGEFRKDLYYRLRSHCLELPPLRDRKGDIAFLLDYFLEEASLAMNKNKPSYPEQLLDLLGQYRFPGNIRELKAMIFDAVGASSTKTLPLETFYSYLEKHRPAGILQAQQDDDSSDSFLLQFRDELPTLKEANRFLIKEALRRTKNNQSMAARMLGISRQTLARNLRSIN